MKLFMNTGGIAQTNCFIVADDEAKQAVLFDAPDHTVTPLLDQMDKRGYDLVGLWLTHGHFDHIADHKVVTDRFPKCQVLIHTKDEPKLKDPTSRFFQIPFTIPPRSADRLIHDGEELTIGSLKAKVIHTPGHSPGHVCYYFESEKLLIGGDLIICGAIGRTDLPDSNPDVMDESVRKIMELPPDTRLMPGHCNRSTLGEERATNGYVRMILENGE